MMIKKDISFTTNTNTKIEPGKVYDISIEEYHSGPGISRSRLTEFQKSPFHYWYKCNNPDTREPVEIIRKINSLEFGNALHNYVLERDQFLDRYVILPKVNRATKAGKEAYQEALSRAFGGKAILCEDAFNEIVAMSASIDSNSDARALISDAFYEKSLYWTDLDTNLLCKARPDIWHDNMIVDLKTTASASYKDFQRSVYGYGYHIQAGMIREAIKSVTNKEINNFIFIAIEKEPPYAVAVYQLDELAINLGATQYQEILKGIRRCEEENNWPSYKSALITVPNWAFSQ